MNPVTAGELGPLPIDKAKLANLSTLNVAESGTSKEPNISPDWAEQSRPGDTGRQLRNASEAATVREKAIEMLRAPGFSDGFTFGAGPLSGTPYNATADALNRSRTDTGAWFDRQLDKVAAFITGPVDDKAIGLGKWGGNIVIDTLNLLGSGGHSDPRRRLPENGFNQMPVSVPRFVPANDTQAGAGVVGDVVTIAGGLRKLVPVRSAGTVGANTAAGLSPGALLRQKYGNLSTQERQAIINDRLENIASDRLASLENSIPGAHFQGRHGAQTTLPQQYDRAVNGIDPITNQARYRADGSLVTPNSSKFMNARDQINAIERATNIFENTGSKLLAQRPIVFKSQAGEGYYGGTGVYGTSYSAQVWFNQARQPITAFPILGK